MPNPQRRGGFTLIEILVVVGIIAILTGLLMPALAKARQQSKTVQCQSNLRQVGQALVMYANKWGGWLYPPGLASNLPREQRWPVHVFKPPVWNPPVMKCPADDLPPPPPTFVGETAYQNGDENGADHTYILNAHLWTRSVKLGSRDLGGLSSAEVIVMGEKRTVLDDYYMGSGNFPGHLERYMHGVTRGANYLYMDWHVATQLPTRDIQRGIDPWDVLDPTTQPTP